MKQIYLLYGDDTFAIEDFQKKIVQNNVDPAWEAFNLDVLDAKDVTYDKVIESVDSAPFGFGNKVTIVKNADILLSQKDASLEALESLFIRSLIPTNILVLCAETVDKRKSLVKTLLNKAEAKEFAMAKSWEVAKKLYPWVEDYLRRFGKRIDQEGLQELVDATGGNKHRLEREIEKLILYVNTANVIKYDDVRKLVTNDQSDVFEFFAYIARKEVDNALLQLNKLLLKENAIKIIAVFSSTFRSVYNQKILAEEHMNNNDIAKKLGQNPYIVDKNLKLWRSYNSEKIRMVLKNLMAMELSFKSTSVNHKLELEKFVIHNF